MNLREILNDLKYSIHDMFCELNFWLRRDSHAIIILATLIMLFLISLIAKI